MRAGRATGPARCGHGSYQRLAREAGGSRADMPLGTIYPDEAAVIHLLAVRRAEFTAALPNVAAAAVIQPGAALYAARPRPAFRSARMAK